MFLVLFWCFYLVFVNANLEEIEIPAFTPLSHEAILNKYFQNKTKTSEVPSRNKKSISNHSDRFYKAIEFMKNDLSTNITNLRREMFAKNITDIDPKNNVSSVVNDIIRSKVLQPLMETTTYKYPTATWSSNTYEKLKQNRSKYFSKSPHFLKRKKIHFDSEISGSHNFDEKIQKLNRNDVLDRFLEESLMKYLHSSNRPYGNLTVKAFSELLKNVTLESTSKKSIEKKLSPYDENKELRIRFRDEVFLKKKNENKTTGGLLEKQLQKRLEKKQDVHHEKTKEKVVSNLLKYEQPNKFLDIVKPLKTTTFSNSEDTTIMEDSTLSAITISTEATSTSTSTEQILALAPASTERILATASTSTEPILVTASTEKLLNSSLGYLSSTNATIFNEVPRRRKHKLRKIEANGRRLARKRKYDSEKDELKLSVAETVYYRKRQSPIPTAIIAEAETAGVIPGVPDVDYPMYNVPPETGFRCPNMKGQRPKMMADVGARCQVFYICTGDGPAAAMLCPNGTMFNENVLVCDWWYNVDC